MISTKKRFSPIRTLTASGAVIALGMALLLTPPSTYAVDPDGSVALDGSTGYIDAGVSTDWNIGTGDFTVEWFAYQTSAGGFNRAFSLGAYPSAALAMSIESGTAYVWVGGSFRLYHSFAGQGAYFNRWIHYAITRGSGNLNLYIDGERVETVSNSTNIDTTGLHLYIGSEVADPSTYFPGNMSNFHFVNGTSLYNSASFSVPTSQLTPVANSKLLLALNNGSTWLDDSSGQSHSVSAQGSAATSSNNPFTVPSAPVLSTPTATTSGASITWSAPTFNSGGITEYEYSLDDSGDWVGTGSTSTSSTITGLTSGDSHSVRVRAINGIGAGLQSNSESFTVLDGLPHTNRDSSFSIDTLVMLAGLTAAAGTAVLSRGAGRA